MSSGLTLVRRALVLGTFFRVWFSRPSRRILFLILVGSILLGALAGQDNRVKLKYRRAEMKITMAPAEVEFVPPNDTLDYLALGMPHFLADQLFIRANMYFLRHLFTDRVYGWFDRYIEAICHLDPLNPSVYLFASRMVKFGQIIDNQTILKSNEYASKGIERFPDEWRFYMEIGFNLYFEYKPVDDVDSEQKRSEATRFFSTAATLPGSQIDPNFIAELYLRANSVESALALAYELYFDASETERESLRGRVALIEKEAAEELGKIEKRWKDNFSYVPPRLAPLLGDPIIVSDNRIEL